MSKKNKQHAEPVAEVETDPIAAQAKATLSTLDAKEKTYQAEIDTLSLQLGELKAKVRKIHSLRKQLHLALGIEMPESAPAEVPAEG